MAIPWTKQRVSLSARFAIFSPMMTRSRWFIWCALAGMCARLTNKRCAKKKDKNALSPQPLAFGKESFLCNVLAFDFALKHDPIDANDPQSRACRTVLFDQHLPGAVVDPDFTMAIDDGRI